MCPSEVQLEEDEDDDDDDDDDDNEDEEEERTPRCSISLFRVSILTDTNSVLRSLLSASRFETMASVLAFDFCAFSFRSVTDFSFFSFSAR